MNVTRVACGPAPRNSGRSVNVALVNSGPSGRGTKAASRLALAVALALVVASVAAGGSTGARAAAGETVTIAFLPVEPTALAVYADRQGFFRKHGIDAKLVPLVDPGATAAAILSGDAQFAAFDVGGLLLAKSQGAPLKLVAGGAAYRQSAPTAALVSAPGKRFAGARDLVGKRIGYDRPGSIAHVALLRWLAQSGVREEDVTLVRSAFQDMVGALTQGAMDAAVLPEPFFTAARQRGARIVAPVFGTVCAADCLLTVWIARKDVDSTLAARFRNAIQEAAVWANRKANDAASGAILAQQTPIEQTVIRKMTRSRFATRLRLAQVQPWMDAYVGLGLIKQPFPTIELVR